MDSVVARRPDPVVGLRRLSRRHVLLTLAALLAVGLALVAAIREFAPRLVDTSPPPQDVCGVPGVTAVNGQITPATWDNSRTWVIESACAGGVTVPFGTTLTLDGQHGPVTILTHGPGLTVSGGTLRSANTSAGNTVSFDTEFDAPTWPGIYVTTDTAIPAHRGTANLAFVTVGGHLNLSGKPDYGIRIDSGATSLAGGFGMILSHVNVFNSSIDGIHSVDTPIQVSGGTISDAGSAGIDATFTSALASSGVSVSGVTVARSGNEGILADLASAQPAVITGNTVTTAGLYGIHLVDAASPTVTGNTISCSGHQDSLNCPGARTRYPAIFLDGGSFNFTTIGTNQGSQNGMDAIAMHGTVTSDLTWVNPSDSSSTTAHTLGYLVAGGDGLLTIQRKTLTVPAGGVVKVAGALTINNGRLEASAGNAVFTSLDDNGPAGITQACPSIFFTSCPSPLGGSEWSGITLRGDATGPASALFDHATVAHGSTAVSISDNGWNFGSSNLGLIVRNGSLIQNGSSDGIVAIDTPLLIDHSTVSGLGAHGISASFLGPAPASAGMTVTSSTIQSTGNEGILGTALSGQPVTIAHDLVNQTGAYGIRLENAGLGGGSLALRSNTLTANGSGSTPYPAVYLNGVTADFTTGVTGNAGNGNGLDAIVFHGTALGNLAWQTALVNGSSTTPLGYLLDAGLVMNGGTLTVHAGDVVKAARGGQITINGPYSVNGSDLSSNRVKVFTSLKDTTQGIPICPATVLADCSAPSPGDWGGLNLTGGAGARIDNGLLRYASTGVAVDHGAPVTLNDSSIDSTSSDGITAVSTVVSNDTIDGAGFSGINLQGADQLTLQGNVIRHSGFSAGGPYPAIYLNGVTGDFTTAVSGNGGALNALNALAFHGSATTNLSWKSATPASVVSDLGYLVDGDLTLGSGQSLTVHAGDVVKVEGGAIHLNGGVLAGNGSLNGAGAPSPAPRVFTSLSDNSVGLLACPSSLLAPCPRQPRAGDWGGLILTEDSGHDQASASLSNAIVRYAVNGISISSGASSAPGSSSYGLVLDHSRIGQTTGDGIISQDTPVALTSDSISSAGGHGVSVDLLGAPAGAGILVRNLDVANTGADGFSASSLTGRPVWIADSRIRNAGSYGLHVKDADRLVLRNNFICGSGAAAGQASGCAAGAAYPAVYLNGVTADFIHDVRGNVGQNNGLDAIVMHGTVTTSLNWIDPSNSSSPHALGYLLDASLTMNGSLTLTVHDATVKALGGGITLNGGTLDASNATFTSLADGPAGNVNLCPTASSPSPFLVCGQAPRADNWGGITVTNDESGHAGSATLVNSHVKYALTGIAIDNGAPAGLLLQGTEIGPTNADGITAQDTAVTVGDWSAVHSSIHNVGARGINASFTGTTAAGGVTVSNASFNQSGKEAILANVISGQAVGITGNTISNAGTYGIQLIGAVSPMVKNNTLLTTGFTGTSAGTHFPAAYLNGVSGGDFVANITGNKGFGNNLDAIAFHGSTGPLSWLTVQVNGAAPDPLGYLVDGSLTIGGNFTVPDASVVRTAAGAITVNGNLLA
ncbi:MAG: right-handed parallel beta-helix repeat-containing protein, partial [Chloroflexi bacterium]